MEILWGRPVKPEYAASYGRIRVPLAVTSAALSAEVLLAGLAAAGAPTVEGQVLAGAVALLAFSASSLSTAILWGLTNARVDRVWEKVQRVLHESLR